MKKYLELYKGSKEKIYIQLYNLLKFDIINNLIKDGSKLPSVRQISIKYSVNTSTVLKAYNLLERENFIVKIIGKGSFVSNKNAILINEKEKPFFDDFCHRQLQVSKEINFSKGTLLSNYFPIDLYKSFANKIFMENSPSIFEYQCVQGIESLRDTLANKLEYEDIFINSKDIIVTSGTQQSLNIIINFFRQQGKPNVAVAYATYPNALNLIKNFCNVFPISQKSDGWDLKEFESLLQSKNITFIYEVFNFQNPTGITWSPKKKRQLIELSQKYNFSIIEDNSFSDFYSSKNLQLPLKAYAPNNEHDNVFYIKTFSKLIMPGIETAFLLPPKRFIEQLILIKHSLGTPTNGFNQKILEYFISSKKFDRHFSLVRNHVKEKLAYALKILQEITHVKILYTPKGGFFIWIELSPDINMPLFHTNCEKNNISILNSSVFFSHDSHKNLFRISISSLTLDEISIGLMSLKKSILNSIN